MADMAMAEASASPPQSGIASASASASSASCEGGSARTTVSIHAAAAVAGLSFDGGSSSREVAEDPLVQPTFANVPPPPPPAPVAEEELEDDDDQAEAAAERLMQSVERGFAAAKAKGVPAATRLLKELRQVCSSVNGLELELVNDDLQVWQVSLFDWAFDEESPLHKDLQSLSESKDDLVPLVLQIRFPDDFPFTPPLVFCASPTLHSEYVFDGALCMEMLVDWQPTYGNVETMLVQVTAFLSHSSARVASCVGKGAIAAAAAAAAGAGDDEASAASIAATQEKAKRAYENLKAFHDKKGWGPRRD